MPLFHELCAIHRAIFEEQFERLEWSMIASFECNITRVSTDIKLHKTTCWVSPDRDPRGCMTLSNAAISRAIGEEGDTKIILGFANNEYVARQAIGTHSIHLRPQQDDAQEAAAAFPSRNRALMVATRLIGKKKSRLVGKGARRRQFV
eukprot:gene4598-10272_t